MNLPDEKREELTAYLFGAATSREVFASPMAAGGYAKWSEGIADALAPLLAGWLAEGEARVRARVEALCGCDSTGCPCGGDRASVPTRDIRAALACQCAEPAAIGAEKCDRCGGTP